MPKIASTPRDAVSQISSDCNIWVHSMAATPWRLLVGLAEHAAQCKNISVYQLHLEHAEPLADAVRAGRIRPKAYFASKYNRHLIDEGKADYLPISLSEIPRLFRSGYQPIDVALIQVSPPDKHGICSLGISVEATRAACEAADLIIAHVNPLMPRTHGDAFIKYSRIDVVYEEAVPITEHVPEPVDDVMRQIGEHVAGLIDDGACLQMGIGAIPDATLSCLTHHKDLGIHTEMFSDGVVPLVEKGVITNRFKKLHPGKLVTGFVMGSNRVYEFVDNNPEVAFLDIEYINDIRNISRNKNVISINSALQIDLTGQVCADSLGTHIYSGVGGQFDFVQGATLSEGGRSILAFPSTAGHGKVSRITPVLQLGSGVVTPRGSVQYIVTEHGVANLYGKPLHDRAKALIDIAHPDFREMLARQAKEYWNITV